MKNLMAKETGVPPDASGPGQRMSNELSRAGEMAGLTKIEAEDLLDQLEAVGYDLCQLSFDDDHGFRVRPNTGSKEGNAELIAN